MLSSTLIDELGYLAYDARAADLIFQLVSRRYEHRSLLITTNLPFKRWDTVFPNASCAVCCRARGTDRNWTRVDRKMLWSPAASSSQQRARVLTDVKARRFAPPPLRGADGLDAGSAHGSSRLALADDAHSYTPYMLWSTSRPE